MLFSFYSRLKFKSCYIIKNPKVPTKNHKYVYFLYGHLKNALIYLSIQYFKKIFNFEKILNPSVPNRHRRTLDDRGLQASKETDSDFNVRYRPTTTTTTTSTSTTSSNTHFLTNIKTNCRWWILTTPWY
jgi:hypothetical protein